MKGRTILIVAVVVLVLVGAAAAYVFRPVPEASEPMEAMPVKDSASESDEGMQEMETEHTEEEAMSKDEMIASGAVVFTITQDQSQVSFTLDEDLRDIPTTVVGVTDQVAGEVHLDTTDPSATQIGTISINARTLATDSEFRNRAINNEILDVGTYEFITFTPTAIEGLPSEIVVGQSYDLTVTGDLTIRDITRSETFAVSAMLTSHTQLEGHGKATVLRTNYALTIPSVPHVANVTDEVLLAIDFVALAE